jgi:uncharacterized lipoprotein
MSHSRIVFRTAVATALVVAVVGASGCRWFRKGDDLYAQSPESRPLEVPPDLDQPDTSGAMKMPPTAAAGGSVTRSSMPAPAASTGSNTGFTVSGERDAVFEKVGEILAATTGATVVSKAQLLGTYDVDYEGSKFLVRVTKVDAGTYVSAVDPRGLPATGDAPAKLIAALKAGLGAG